MVRSLALALFVLSGSLLTAPCQAQSWKREFAEKIKSQDSWVRQEAVGVVDPAGKGAAKVLLGLLAEERLARVDPWIRQGIIEQLSRVRREDKKAHKTLLKGLKAKQERVREGVLMALGLRGDPEDTQTLIQALETKKSSREVRAALAGLETWPDDPRVVQAILDAWPRPKAPGEVSRLGVLCSLALARITNKDFGLDLRKWLRYWEKVKATWPDTPQDEQAEEGEPKPAEPMRTRTRVKDVPLSFTERGEGSTPLLVIPDDQYKVELYTPWFRALEDVYRVIYMDLPSVKDFDQSKLKMFNEKLGIPYYPVDLLVEAFEGLREQKKIERFAFLSHGYNALIAQRYLSLYGDHVSEVIMINPISGSAAWSRIINGIQVRGQGSKDDEMVHLARNMQIYPDGKHDYEPKSSDDSDALARKTFFLYFGDTNDVMVSDLFEDVHKGADESVSPDFELSRQKRSKVPMLIQFGALSPWTVESDRKRFAGHYPNARVEVYPSSSMCPFMEDTGAWSKAIHEFFERTHPEAGPKKKD